MRRSDAAPTLTSTDKASGSQCRRTRTHTRGVEASVRKAPGVLLTITLAALVVATTAFPVTLSHDVAEATEVAGRGKPDIILIVADDQPTGLMDIMPWVQSQLRDKGVQYVNAMVPTSLCCPSRASMLTGMYAHGTKVWDNGLTEQTPNASGGHHAFVEAGDERKTLAVALDNDGYRTGLLGKYLNGYRPNHGVPPGWDVWLPFESGAAYYDYDFNGQHRGSLPEDYSTGVIARNTARVIERTPASQPLFLYVAPFGPHWPYTPAPRYVGRDVTALIHERDFGALNEPDVGDKPGWVKRLDPVHVDAVESVAKQQHRATKSVDDLVRDVVRALAARSNLRNTMIVFVSDNGYLWGEHRVVGKDVAYASATEVPLFIRYGARLGSGIANGRLALNIDLTATMAQAAGVKRSMPWLEGESLLRPRQRSGFVLEGTFSNPHQPDFMERPPYCGWRSLDSLFVSYSTGFEEFYRYPLDPYERTNRINEPAWQETIQSMRSKARKHCHPEPPGFNWN